VAIAYREKADTVSNYVAAKGDMQYLPNMPTGGTRRVTGPPRSVFVGHLQRQVHSSCRARMTGDNSRGPPNVPLPTKACSGQLGCFRAA